MQTPSAVADVLAASNIACPASPAAASIHEYLDRVAGDLTTKVITINGDDATVNVNCFQITGSVEVMKIYGKVLTKTVLDSCTDINFNLNDSTATVQLTKSTTATALSNLAIGTIFIKNSVAADAVAVANNAAGALTEPATGNKAYFPFIVTQKTGANTYIRFTYTTAGNAQNSTFQIWVEYRPIGVGTLAAV